MKILAGEVFHHRKPKQAPISAEATTARSSGSRTSKQALGLVHGCAGLLELPEPMKVYAPKTITEAPVARPSRPSVRFTPLLASR